MQLAIEVLSLGALMAAVKMVINSAVKTEEKLGSLKIFSILLKDVMLQVTKLSILESSVRRKVKLGRLSIKLGNMFLIT